MNRYKKYCPNVFVAECDDKHNKGDEIIITTKYGKENEHIVHNLLGKTREDKYCYSITRADGFNNQRRAKNKASRLNNWASSADNKSTDYYNKSNKNREFLILGEPIKVGHHSERRHRKMFEDNNRNMGKSVELSDKADMHRSKAAYWERLANKVDLSMPESIEFFTEQLKDAKEYHVFLRDNPDKRPHYLALQYANKKVKELESKVKTANRLWSDSPVVEEPKKQKKDKLTQNEVDNFEGLFFAFNTDQFKEGMLKVGLSESDKDKIIDIGYGGYIRKDRKEAFLEMQKRA